MYRFLDDIDSVINGRIKEARYKNLHLFRNAEILLYVELGPPPYDAASEAYRNLQDDSDVTFYTDEDFLLKGSEITKEKIEELLDQYDDIQIKTNNSYSIYSRYSSNKTYNYNGYRIFLYFGLGGGFERDLKDIYQKILINLDEYERRTRPDEIKWIFRTGLALDHYFISDLSQEILTYL